MKTILVTGAKGQIGSDLVHTLRDRHGVEAVIESDVYEKSSLHSNGIEGPYESLNVTDRHRFEDIIKRYDVGTVYHLASLLSARGEQNPYLAWDVNMNGLKNVLDLAVQYQFKLFWPSSIAVFGPYTQRNYTPQHTILDPTTIYGVTKVSGELLCRYYAEKMGVDVRSVRYPGIISYTAPPGGGTTDYAVEIFYEAIQKGHYTCFVRPDTRLPMMYMPDAIRATLNLMAAEPESIRLRTSYNLAAFSFSAEELVREITRNLPGFTCEYKPDYHQAIADSWPSSIDDSEARTDWDWKPAWDMPSMCRDMLTRLKEKLPESVNG